jgi:hypothetical protein
MLAAGMLFRWTVRRRRMVDACWSRTVALSKSLCRLVELLETELADRPLVALASEQGRACTFTVSCTGMTTAGRLVDGLMLSYHGVY